MQDDASQQHAGQAVESRSANDWARKGPGTMANADAELEKLKEAVRVACQRVTQVIQTVADPAAIKAATDICAEAVEALRAYVAKIRTRR
jgi:hypothetical protein